MREIKFRFWSKILHKFVTPQDDIFVGALKDPKMIVMQYTGLKDKNGAEIFEGDILHWKNLLIEEDKGNVEVIWEWASFALKKINGNDLARWSLWKNIDDQDTEGNIAFEVIGNIMETPELVK